MPRRSWDWASRLKLGALDGGYLRREITRRDLEELIEGSLGVRPGEGRRTALCFAYLFLGSAVFILGRTARDTLFLSRYPLSALPWMFVLFGVVSALVAIFYGAVADRAGRMLQVRTALAVGAASYAGVWFLVRAGARWVYPAFYVWTEVVANLLIMQFWTLANDLHDPRAGKRLFGTIGSARILGVIVCGVGSGLVVKSIGTVNLLWVLVGLVSALFVLSFPLGRERAVAPGQGTRRQKKEPLSAVAKNPYVRALTVVILLVFVVLTLGDYQFKVIARAAYAGHENDLARFFSLFYAAAGLAGFLFQILATPRILRRYGVLAAMLVMPIFFGGSSLALLLVGGLTAATFMKFSDNGFQYTIHETAVQVLYVPFSPALKAKTRAFLDTAVKPMAYGLGGLVLVLAVQWMGVPVRSLSFVTLPLAIAWLAFLPRARKEYLKALEASLSGKAAAFSTGRDLVLDSESRALLVRALDSADGPLVLHALDRLKEEDTPELRQALRRLASHAEFKVREESLKRIGQLADGAGFDAVRAGLSDTSPEVRAAALRALFSIQGDEAAEPARPFAGDPSRAVRVAAVSELILHGGVEGAAAGGGRLEALLQDKEPKRRAEAAEVLGLLGPPGYRPLRRLLLDESPSVRKAALRSASAVADSRLVPLLMEALERESTRGRVGKALAAIGTPAVPALSARLGDQSTPRPIKLFIPRILKQIPSREAFEALAEHTAQPDGHVRLRVFSAMGSLRERLGLQPLALREVERLASEEVDGAFRLLGSWVKARASYGTPLLGDSVALSLRRYRRRLLRILELRYARAEVALVMRNLENSGRSAMAIETLDTLLDARLKPQILPLMEDLPAERLIEHAGGRRERGQEPLIFLAARCVHPEPYCAFAALTAAAEHGEAGVLPEARGALGSADALVREGAAIAVGKLAPKGELDDMLTPVLADPAPVVAVRARAILSGTEEPMYSTVEKILFLMSVPIFDKLSGEDLAPIAQAAEVESHSKGARIVKEGDVGDSLYVVLRGLVRIEKRGQVLAELGPKATFGEMAVLDAAVRSADAVAQEDTEVLKIGSDEFYDILHEQSEIAEGVIKVLTRRLREADVRIGVGTEPQSRGAGEVKDETTEQRINESTK